MSQAPIDLDCGDINCLQIECDELQKKYNLLQTELRIVDQELFENESQCLAAKERETSFEHEIDLLKQKEISAINDLEFKIKHISISMKEEITNECITLDQEIAKYQDELTVLEGCRKEDALKEVVEELCIDHCLIALRDRLKDEVGDKIIEKDQAQIHNTYVKIKVSAIQIELEQLRKQINCTIQETLETESVLNNLEEELVLTKSELAIEHRTIEQVNDSNSLFAEVNDRRVELRNTMEMIKFKCNDIKNIAAVTQKELLNLRFLSEELSNYKKIYDDDCNRNLTTLCDMYLRRINTLEYILEEYKRDVLQMHQFEQNGLPLNILQVLNNLEEEKKNIIATVENKNGREFCAQKMLHLQLNELELKNAEMKQMIENQLQPKVQELKNIIETSKIDNVANEEILKKNEDEETRKENCINSEGNERKGGLKKTEPQTVSTSKPEIKRVMFAEVAGDAQEKLSTLKRGGKKSQNKSVHISDLMAK